MLLESSRRWKLSSWIPGLTVYLLKEIISLSPQYTQYKSYSFLPSILGVEFFLDLIEALMMGLWCWKLDSWCFLGPEEPEDEVVWWVLSRPSAFQSQVQSDVSLSELLKGEGWRWGWCGSRADGYDFYQKVISSWLSVTSVSLDRESTVPQLLTAICPVTIYACNVDSQSP